MVLKYKPLYQCDGCSLEFEDPDKVRIFESLVKNGNQTKQYIETGMFCLDCIPLALDFSNQNPETVKIIDPTDPTKVFAVDSFENFEKRMKLSAEALNDVRELKQIFFEFAKETNINIKNLDLKFKDLHDLINSLTKSSETMEDKILREEAQHFIKHGAETITEEEFLKNARKINLEITEKVKATPNPTLDKALEKFGQDIINEFTETPQPQHKETSQEPDTINENTQSETEEDELGGFGEDSGKHLILRLIDDESAEIKFSQKNNYKDVKDLRAAYGNKSLVGLYYSTNKFIDDFEDTTIFVNQKQSRKVINKVFFGVPNVVERECYLSRDYPLALIEKDLFEDKIEPIKYEIPEEQNIDLSDEHKIIIQAQEPGKPTVNKMLNRFVNEAVEESKPKKTFSRKNIGDDYI